MTNSKHGSIRSLLLAATMLVSPLILVAAPPAVAQIGISVQIAPPLLPVYAQPPMPEEGYLWTPGYWAWGQEQSYYWVPGTWVRPPMVGVLWTPPYWGWGAGGFLFHGGYWGATVGFYGGINYGFGYGGVGYGGGRWENGAFAYNSAANNFGSFHVAHTYERNVTVVNDNHVGYVGGEGGLKAEPNAEERAAERERHVPATAEQTQHIAAAAKNPELAASRNHGNPAVAATARPVGSEGARARPEIGKAGEPGTRLGTARPAAEAKPEHAAEAKPERPAEARPEHAAEAKPAPKAPHPAVAHQAPRPAEAKPEHPAAAVRAAPPPAPARQAQAEKGNEEKKEP